jgi:hypothetical protein
MKINPLGIQSYQTPNANRPQTDKKPSVGTGDAKVVITPQPEGTPSAVSIKVTPTDFGSLLTEPERKAMEALFARFKENGKIAGNVASEADRGLGKFVDIKV